MKNVFPFAFFEGKFVKTENAKVSVMTNAIHYGTGVFGGIRGYYDEEKKELSVFRIKEHYQRFISSLKIIGVKTKYTEKELEEIALKLVQKNKPKKDVYFRSLAYASSLNLSPNLARDSIFEFVLYMIPLGEYLPVNKGLSVMVSSWRRISDSAVPIRAKISGTYINSALARKEACDKNFDEAIFLTNDGHVSEGSAENIFIVRDGVLITPAKSEDVLEGITRRTVIELAEDLNIPVVERKIDRTELYVCDEAFFTGTGVQISWISKIDNRIIGNGKRGKITEKLQDLFFKAVQGKEKKYQNWCTKIKI